MAAPTFYWHDYETFGRSPRRDRPAQFAGVRTDAALNEIGEPLMLHCRPAPDYLPEPDACLLTGLTPQRCLALGVPEHRFAAEIVQQLGAEGTIGVGYNSIRFDDEVTRFLLWRNLHDPYAREWQNGCGRWDLLDVVRCAYALRPQGLEWPRHDDGRPSFRLEHLAAANGLAHAAAHDALSDVRATIALGRLLRARQARLWDFCLRLRRKDEVLDQIGLGEPRPFLHVSGMYGSERGCIAIVWPLGPHPTNRNELLVWDLQQDPAQLHDLDAEAIRERLFMKTEDLPDGVARLPVKSIHLNRSPVVIGNLKTLGDAQAARWGIDVDGALRHAEAARARGPLDPAIWRAVYARPPAPPADVDEDLYGGFLPDEDRTRLERLRAVDPLALAAARPAFADPRLEELLFRYRARSFPETLAGDEPARWEAHRAARLHRGAGGAQTLGEFLDRIDVLSDGADERGEGLLGELVDYAHAIAPEAPQEGG